MSTIGSVSGLLRHGSFQFRTLEEVQRLSEFLCQVFPQPENALYGLSELMLNAVEHGNLGITFEEKSRLLQQGQWRAEVLRRLEKKENQNSYASIEIDVSDGQTQIIIRDQGKGFDWKPYLAMTARPSEHMHGRGIWIARQLSFTDLQYQGCGNEVIATCRAA